MKKSNLGLLAALVFSLLAWQGMAGSAGAANEIFLSNDVAESEVTYVIQFDTSVKGNIDRIRIGLPPGTSAANAALGRLIIRDKVFEGDEEENNDVKLSVDLFDSNALIVDLGDDREAKAGTRIRIELFNLNNPVAGDYAIDVRTIGKKGNVLEVISPIAFSAYADVGPQGLQGPMGPAGSGASTSHLLRPVAARSSSSTARTGHQALKQALAR